MDPLSIPEYRFEIDEETGTPRTLAGFISHYQNAQRIAREANRLYLLSQADPSAEGLLPEDIPARLARVFR